MSRNKKTIKKISALSGGLAMTTIDLTVLVAALAGGLIVFGPGPYERRRKQKMSGAIRAADWIYQSWDRSKFRDALSRALGQGLFERIKDGHRLTNKGKKHLQELLPSYKNTLQWDGRLWLISYDIAEDDRRRRRDVFRQYLEEIGCGMVQHSLWLSIKDPRPWLEPKISELRLKQGVIVSCLGKDGYLGKGDPKSLVAKIYPLKEINSEYKKWLKKTQLSAPPDVYQHGLEFLAILNLDPVLPQELLPNDWQGETAKQIFSQKYLPEMGDISVLLG